MVECWDLKKISAMFFVKNLFHRIFFLQLLLVPALVKAKETALGEADNFGELLSLIWSWGLKIILPLSILTLIVAGFMYMSSEGDEEKLTQAKEV